MKTGLISFGIVMAGMLAGTAAMAAEPPGSVDACAGCHALDQTPEQTLSNRQQRTAPPLYYAGNKFREEWLVSWLQNPERIRPAGDYPPAHTVVEDGKDVVDESSLQAHPALSQNEAEEIASWLMTLTPHDDLIAAEADYEPGNVNPRMGAMDFVKFKGCGGCHKDAPEYGGFSGPELYTAWERLQPAFINSYIRNPEEWEPYTLMPNKGLGTSQVHKLTDYLRVIDESEE